MTLDVGNVPDRKSKALSLQQGNTTRVLAYFISEDAYERFCEVVKDGTTLLWRDTQDEEG